MKNSRDAAGRWRSRHFASRTTEFEPSRPMALLGGKPEREFVVYSRYARTGPTPRGSQIDSGEGVLPPGQPWIVLASDTDGNVYEGRLRE